ncbi:MAG: methylated-DNA--[protein]-cysteine S-methyltransferase [Chlamydiales bacterium]
MKPHILYTSQFASPIGSMTAIADEEALLFLDFSDSQELKNYHQFNLKELVEEKSTTPLRMIEKEMQLYFQGKQIEFRTPIKMFGSSFKKQVWHALQKIPFGKTCSYSDIACRMNHPKATRAVGNANKMNPLVIIIPCHRVICHNHTLGGYRGGIMRKKWLLNHESHDKNKVI